MNVKDISAFKAELLDRFSAAWPTFEEILLRPASDAAFGKFLAQYHGLPRSHQGSEEAAHWQQQLGEELHTLFQKLFHETLFVKESEAENLTKTEIEDVLQTLEQSCNLALYYWSGKSNRNYQFRTIVHFAELEGLAGPLFTAHAEEFLVSFSEYGVRLSTAADEHIPKVLPVSDALALEEFPPHSLQQEMTPAGARKLFARVRTVQREVCLLVEEWEHRNALLAVEHNMCRDTLRQKPSRTAEEAFRQASEKLSAHRDFLAEWCMVSFVAIERWLAAVKSSLNERKSTPFELDILAEIDAAESVVLSGLQKIYLPASVSRHTYGKKIPELVFEWCEARLQAHKDDVATQLTHACTSLILDPSHAQMPDFAFLKQKSFEWVLSYDPCTPLKSFCWQYSWRSHVLFTTCALIALAKKLNPAPLDTYWIANLATLLQMPQTYSIKASTGITENPEFASREQIQFLCSAAKEALQKATVSAEAEEYRDYLLQNIEKVAAL